MFNVYKNRVNSIFKLSSVVFGYDTVPLSIGLIHYYNLCKVNYSKQLSLKNKSVLLGCGFLFKRNSRVFFWEHIFFKFLNSESDRNFIYEDIITTSLKRFYLFFSFIFFFFRKNFYNTNYNIFCPIFCFFLKNFFFFNFFGIFLKNVKFFLNSYKVYSTFLNLKIFSIYNFQKSWKKKRALKKNKVKQMVSQSKKDIIYLHNNIFSN